MSERSEITPPVRTFEERELAKRALGEIIKTLVKEGYIPPNDIDFTQLIPSEVPFSTKVSLLRTYRGMTIGELAEEIGADKSTVYRIEEGNHSPKIETAIAIARA